MSNVDIKQFLRNAAASSCSGWHCMQREVIVVFDLLFFWHFSNVAISRETPYPKRLVLLSFSYLDSQALQACLPFREKARKPRPISLTPTSIPRPQLPLSPPSPYPKWSHVCKQSATLRSPYIRALRKFRYRRRTKQDRCAGECSARATTRARS